MSDTDIEALKAAAEKATPGEWKLWPSHDAGPHEVFLRSELGSIDVDHYGFDDPDGSKSREMLANATFIALANPSAILELIAQRAAVVEACQALVAACDTAPPVEIVKHIGAACEKARAALTADWPRPPT